MVGWIEKQMDDWMDRKKQMDGWMDRKKQMDCWMYKKNGWMDGYKTQMIFLMDGQKKWMDYKKQKNGWRDRKKDNWMDRNNRWIEKSRWMIGWIEKIDG